jgi:DNA-directed RNA polymerase subunit L
MNRTQEDTASYWLELVIEDSYNEDMSSLEFGQTAHKLINLLHNMILADEAIVQARHDADGEPIR